MHPITAIVMTKEPRPGAVKTRLTTGQGALTPSEAALVAEAMLECLVGRLLDRGRVILAGDPPGAAARLAASHGWSVDHVDQSDGDLGDRLAHVWAGCDGPVAFFGIDSPDVPDAHLDDVAGMIERYDVVLGPTDDGGYWTLAASQPRPEVLGGVDWGTDQVLRQSIDAAETAGLSVGCLPAWSDVDTPADLAALLDRLSGVRCPHRSRLRDRLLPVVTA